MTRGGGRGHLLGEANACLSHAFLSHLSCMSLSTDALIGGLALLPDAIDRTSALAETILAENTLPTAMMERMDISQRQCLLLQYPKCLPLPIKNS